MMDMVSNRDFAHALMDKVMEFPLVIGKKLIELGVDMLWTGDDVGMQTGMMISLALWREYLKPRYAKLYSEFKKLNPTIKIAYHSCGNCEAILDEMYEIGLDVINPIQASAMNPGYIKKRYGKKLALWGTLDEQRVLPFGTSDEVKAEVERLIRNCAGAGGFILAPVHNIQSDTSIENILAFYEAAKEYGQYPMHL
jgi:uroporphyrinogen decarboxylase